MTRSLLDYAHFPELVPSLLPSQEARRSRRVDGFPTRLGWPVDLLPAGAIALDLVERGATYRRGTGYARDGRAQEPDQVARLVPALFDEAAALLPTTRVAEARRYLDEVLPLVEEVTFERVYGGLADGTLDDAGGGSLIALVLDRWRPEDNAIVESLPALAAADEQHAAEAAALRATADELRTSAPARRRLLDALRPHLADLTADEAEDEGEALRWLACFDRREVLRRSELSALYAEAGSPGALPPAALRALAEARWGSPRKVRGHFLYRPTSAPPGPAPVRSIAPAEPPLPARRDSPRARADALAWVRGMAEATGETPAPHLFANSFNLSPAVAAAVATEAALPAP